MQFKEGCEDALKEAILSQEEFIKEYVQFSGNEAKTLIQWSVPRKCKAKLRFYRYYLLYYMNHLYFF